MHLAIRFLWVQNLAEVNSEGWERTNPFILITSKGEPSLYSKLIEPALISYMSYKPIRGIFRTSHESYTPIQAFVRQAERSHMDCAKCWVHLNRNYTSYGPHSRSPGPKILRTNHETKTPSSSVLISFYIKSPQPPLEDNTTEAIRSTLVLYAKGAWASGGQAPK